ncbi:MAG: ABC transporter permease [Candidatus Methanomethylophilus sp.]|nr:ABC transporter permease [Methanomethylophilus sp.]MCI2075497.1 ABC transporter permease [Methanomethylophilus sp.]MCI2093319.1 ABC transporter permease [Methanomethylophilus sp.]
METNSSASSPGRMSGGRKTLSWGKDDVRQSFVVMKNEFRKFFYGKKMLLFLGLTVAVLALIIVMIAALDPFSDEDDKKRLTEAMFISFYAFIILIAVTLFGATSIVSEYEERTALILFTKPIRKSSIYMGKLLASIVLTFVFTCVYYAVSAVSCAVFGGIGTEMLVSFGLSACYIFGANGVALLISSVMKKSSTSSIVVFMLFLVLFTVISSVIETGAGSGTAFWMIDRASNGIVNCLSDSYDDGLRDAAVMLIWGAAASAAGYWLFKRRDF